MPTLKVLAEVGRSDVMFSECYAAERFSRQKEVYFPRTK